MIFIGIDTGTHTGFAVWDSTKLAFQSIETLLIHEAMQKVDLLADYYGKGNVVVYYEDARLRKWYGANAAQKQQGAGSVKRDCAIWEAFLENRGIEAHPIAPKNNKTKLTSEQFQAVSRYYGRTSEHGRDAAMLVLGRMVKE